MPIGISDLKAHCNVTGSDDDAVLTRLLAVASAHVERLLGFALDDEQRLPGGAPADLEHAVLMLAAHWYENREASLVGVVAQLLPLGVQDMVREHRRYTFGYTDGQ